MVIKTALITGASSGIGQAFAEELAVSGTNLILVARSQDKLDTIAKQLRETASINVEVIVRLIMPDLVIMVCLLNETYRNS